MLRKGGETVAAGVVTQVSMRMANSSAKYKDTDYLL